jgi:hypothetical protein
MLDGALACDIICCAVLLYYMIYSGIAKESEGVSMYRDALLFSEHRRELDLSVRLDASCEPIYNLQHF